MRGFGRRTVAGMGMIGIFAGLSAFSAPAAAQSLPPGYSASTVVGNFNFAVGLCFGPDGRIFVWEKSGRVWLVENGVKSSQPLIDISEEVGNWRDLGLLGFAIDPDFANNGRIYLAYTVDFHHLNNFGTPNYNPAADEYFRDTIGRVVRYTCNASDGYRSVDYSSRTVLIGETRATGIPMLSQSHHIGSLVFGSDGTLLLSTGDGGDYAGLDDGGPHSQSSNTALADGIIQPREDVGAFRSQLLNSHSGKVLRIDPATGDGVPSNPWYDAQNPRSARSRVYALGLRNPFRMTRRPGTGSTNPADCNPGEFYIGDVGWYQYEEINRLSAPRQNFGWPIYEGLVRFNAYFNASPVNVDAPNPLFGVGGCAQPFFRFRDLIIQDTLLPGSWPNPCNNTVQIAESTPRFKHTRPVIEFGHGLFTRVPTWSGNTATATFIDSPGSPVTGIAFDGYSAIGGCWTTGSTVFDDDWNNTYLFADFVMAFIRALDFTESGTLTSVRIFAENVGAIVAMEMNPFDGSLYYIAYSETGTASLRRITRAPNNPPIAAASASVAFGPAPLPVSFSSAGTTDPENEVLSYLWDFGDGVISKEPNPSHVYLDDEDVTLQGVFAGRILELSPPQPIGGGSLFPQVIYDGVFPPEGSQDSAQQYDTFHNGDQGNFDWIGYTFPQPVELKRVIFQEGKHFENGGWFDTLALEYFNGTQWLPVPGATISPPYAGNNAVSYERYTFNFLPVTALGVRIAGDPGGSSNFISVGELRIRATPVIPGRPVLRQAILTVTDAPPRATPPSRPSRSTTPRPRSSSPRPSTARRSASPGRNQYPSGPPSPTPSTRRATSPAHGRPSCTTTITPTPSRRSPPAKPAPSSSPTAAAARARSSTLNSA